MVEGRNRTFAALRFRCTLKSPQVVEITSEPSTTGLAS